MNLEEVPEWDAIEPFIDLDDHYIWNGEFIDGRPVVKLSDRKVYVQRYLYQRRIGAVDAKTSLTSTCGNDWCCKPEHMKKVAVKKIPPHHWVNI